MKYDIEYKGMKLCEKNQEAEDKRTSQRLLIYDEKLKKLKEEEDDG